MGCWPAATMTTTTPAWPDRNYTVSAIGCWNFCYLSMRCHSTCAAGQQPIGNPVQCATSGSNQCQGQYGSQQASFSFDGPQHCQCQCQGYSFTTNGPQTQIQSPRQVVTPADLEMTKLDLGGDAFRCSGNPVKIGGKTWNNLGVQNTANDCRDQCSRTWSCLFAVYN